MKHLTITMLVMGLLINRTSLLAGEPTSCRNCEATVVLESNSVPRFQDALRMMRPMPLRGIVVAQGSSAYATVLVVTDPIYAAEKGVDSFDVAKVIRWFAGDGFGIRSVTAIWQGTP